MFAVLQVSGQSDPDTSNRKYILAGFDANAFISIKTGYGYKHSGFSGNRDLLVYGYFSIPLLLCIQDSRIDTWKIESGISSEIFKFKKVGLRTNIDLFLLNQRQVLGTFTPIGADLGISGHQGRAVLLPNLQHRRAAQERQHPHRRIRQRTGIRSHPGQTNRLGIPQPGPRRGR